MSRMLIEQAKPNKNRNIKMILRLVIFLFCVFFSLAIWANYRDVLDVDWLSTAILLFVILALIWNYKVCSRWEFELDSTLIQIEFYFNFFFWGECKILGNYCSFDRSKWFSKTFDFDCRIEDRDFLICLERKKKENYFTCSVFEKVKSDQT